MDNPKADVKADGRSALAMLEESVELLVKAGCPKGLQIVSVGPFRLC